MALIGPLIGAGASLVGGAIESIGAGARNRKQRKFTEMMYSRQVADAERFWNMQNEYNLPSNQMARLKAAGLNPNLVYGNGADATAGSISTPSPQSYNPENTFSAVGRGLSSGLAEYNATRLADAEVQLKRANAAAVSEGIVRKKIENEILTETKDDRIMASHLGLSEKQFQVELRDMETSIKRDLFNKGLSLDKAVADALYSVMRNNKVDVDIKAVQSLIKNRDIQTLLAEMERDLRNTTGQTYGSGSDLNTLLRFLFTQLGLQ